jgi:hypothetical protein
VNAGLFHLDRLAELAPDDPWVNEQRARVVACQIPPRDPRAPPFLLDLSDVYTGSLDTTQHRELADLPRGVHTLAGTLWDIRGKIDLESSAFLNQHLRNPVSREQRGKIDLELAAFVNHTAPFPRHAVNHIPVRRRCRQLSFLHYVGGNRGRDGEEVAHWVARYADGSTLDWPVIYGEHVRDWWWNYNHPREASQAVIAWEGHPPVLAQSVRLFKATWTNPRPDIEIQELDFVSGEAPVEPTLVAITAE